MATKWLSRKTYHEMWKNIYINKRTYTKERPLCRLHQTIVVVAVIITTAKAFIMTTVISRNNRRTGERARCMPFVACVLWAEFLSRCSALAKHTRTCINMFLFSPSFLFSLNYQLDSELSFRLWARVFCSCFPHTQLYSIHLPFLL